MTEHYPNAPGFKDITTSKLAADRIEPHLNRLQGVLIDLFNRGFVGTADEAGRKVGLSPFTARPRCTELYKLGLIERAYRVTEDGSTKWALRSVQKQGLLL